MVVIYSGRVVLAGNRDQRRQIALRYRLGACPRRIDMTFPLEEGTANGKHVLWSGRGVQTK
ncbi:hypothetical protein IB238_20480 [Rhizobium sp. ARZ01]|uniref:hypothetical protein n=1 Tax=Rhizobium sp. ARZ01 TaxID=2769313 RepID=UPI00177C02BC|nr:hypothetical protein [Rhizobium sp. ARZ01]MBD9375005.1 hypothetical protein [Rhizobium sp. ARZ01]